jgi:hypothetical protein
MRSFSKAFLSCVAVAAMGVFAPSVTLAHGYHYSCSSFDPTVTVVAGPCPVSTTNPVPDKSSCEASGAYTGILYHVTGSPDYIAALVTANNTVVSGGRTYEPCKGDPVTDLGDRSCHEQAVTFGCNSASVDFWIVVAGRKGPVLQSVALKKDSCIQSVAVTGLGYDISQFQVTQNTESVDFKGCVVDFVTDPLTGTVLSATLNTDKSTIKDVCPTSGSITPGTCCSEPISYDVSKLKLSVTDDQFGCSEAHPCSLGGGQFGNGYVSSGTNSCTTRVIGGRVYSWGSPCP